MEFDFTSIMDRTGKDSIAVEHIPFKDAVVNEEFSRIPMWVADMNFATAPSIIDALQKRVAHPAFGYFSTSKEYYQSIIHWQKQRNGVDVCKEDIGYENGVLGGLLSVLGAVCVPGDYVLLHQPTYIGFTASITSGGYRIIHSPLMRDENGIWRMDYADMDQKIKQYGIRACGFCSPHNPCGRVWERWEIEKAMAVYRDNDCVVISDEIWSDLVLTNQKHIPTQSVSEDAKMRTVALYAPSKTFNLAGLVGSYHIIYNKTLRARVLRKAETSGYNHCNVLSMHALIGAYSEQGSRWLDELRTVLSENTEYAYQYITKHFSGITLAKPEGTYMLYIHCEAWCKSHDTSMDDLIKAGIAVGVIWQDGRPFGDPWAIRINLAVPHVLVCEAMNRLDRYVFNR